MKADANHVVAIAINEALKGDSSLLQKLNKEQIANYELIQKVRSPKQFDDNWIGWSSFARSRHIPGAGYSYFDGNDIELFQLIYDNWDKRTVGSGTTNINAVCIVPVPPDKFHTSNIMLTDATDIETIVHKRREGEEPFLKTVAIGPTVKANYAKVVLYSADELKKDTLDGKDYESPYKWEIVCIIASDVDDEPMLPLAMARNQLNQIGGNYREYTSEEYAKAIWYWSKRVSQKPVSR